MQNTLFSYRLHSAVSLNSTISQENVMCHITSPETGVVMVLAVV